MSQRAIHLRHSVLSFGRDQRGATAVEFAIVGGPFLMVVVGIMVIGLMTFAASSLDYAVQKASRQIMVGTTQGSGLTAGQFQQTILCPLLPAGLFDCSQIVINLTSFDTTFVSGNPGSYNDHYYDYVKTDRSGLTLPSASAFCLGGGGSYQVLEVTYPFPIIFGAITSAPQIVNGHYLMMSSLTFKNEPFGSANVASC